MIIINQNSLFMNKKMCHRYSMLQNVKVPQIIITFYVKKQRKTKDCGVQLFSHEVM